MDEIDSNIRDTLLYIKNNPGCNTNPEALDGFLIKDLESQGLIDGIDATTLSSTTPEFINLRLNIHGEKYLSLLLQPPEKTVSAPHWYSNPIVGGAITFIFTLLGAFIVWRAGWLG